MYNCTALLEVRGISENSTVSRSSGAANIQLLSMQVPRLHREGAQGAQWADSKHLQAEVHSPQGVLKTPEPSPQHTALSNYI